MMQSNVRQKSAGYQQPLLVSAADQTVIGADASRNSAEFTRGAEPVREVPPRFRPRVPPPRWVGVAIRRSGNDC
jgi:hypothetical protein